MQQTAIKWFVHLLWKVSLERKINRRTRETKTVSNINRKFSASTNWSADTSWKFCSYINKKGDADGCGSKKKKDKSLLLKLLLLCVLSFTSSRPAGLSASISWLRQNASGTSNKQHEACVRATHHIRCVVVSGEELPPSWATYSDKPILRWWSKLFVSLRKHPPTETRTRTTVHVELNQLDRQIKKGGEVKIEWVGISFLCSFASLPNWLIKLK